MKLDDTQRAAIGEAVRMAEAGTDGEIMVVTAASSDAYHDVALHWAILAMLLVLALLASFPDFFLGLLGGWQFEWTRRELFTLALILAAAKFLGVRLLLAWRPLRLALTPQATKARRVRRRAIQLFRAGIERRTATRTGVLLYISEDEHRAEIVVDAAIHAQVPNARWGTAMAALVDARRAGRPADGIIAAISEIGAILAETFPRTGTDPDELPDRLIEI